MELMDAVDPAAASSGWFEDGADVVRDELLGKGGCSRQLRKLGGGLYARQ